MKAAKFQEATAQAALAALRREGGSRRFLVADEVGLGKTVVARRVMHELATERPERTLHVVYVCSNLAVASQNRKALLSDIEVEQHRKSAMVGVDRLTLVPADPGTWRERDGRKIPLRLFTLTPGTSLPDARRGFSGTGTMTERATVQALVEWTIGGRVHDYALALNASKHWPARLEWSRHRVTQLRLTSAHAMALGGYLADSLRCDQAGLAGTVRQLALTKAKSRKPWDGFRIPNLLVRQLGDLRSAVGLLAVDLLEPDLVIFDEFQRFPEYVTCPEAGSAGHHRLVESIRGDVGDGRRKMLLLSATPYRLRVGAAGDSSHQDFLDLNRFLFGASIRDPECAAVAAQQAADLRGGLRGVRDAFMTGVVDDTARSARDRAEALLLAVMARTERSDERLAFGEGGTTGTHVPEAANEDARGEPLAPDDLAVFKHMVNLRLGRTPPPVGADVDYWNSVPLPTQTMSGYKSAAVVKSGRELAPVRVRIDKERLAKLRIEPALAHPKLRALFRHRPPGSLALPWVAPSLPWWTLGGGWRQASGGGPAKVLAFSRFVAVPRAVPALVSHAVECTVWKGSDRPTRLTGAFESTSTASLWALALFVPAAGLLCVCDPLAVPPSARAAGGRALLREVARRFDAWLGDLLGERLVRDERAAPIPAPRLLAMLAGALPDTVGVGLVDGGLVPHGEREGPLRKRWNDDVSRGPGRGPIRVRAADLAAVAEIGAFAPGNVLLRGLLRAGVLDLESPVGSADRRVRAARLLWTGLRPRLGHPLCVAALRGARDRGGAQGRLRAGEAAKLVLGGVREGCLESVLDEHLWMLRGQKESLDEVLDELEKQAAPLRGHVEFQDGAGGQALRLHVAMPFRTDGSHKPRRSTGPRSSDEEAGPNVADRPDLIRTVFNGPFWPHVLVSTSVGQEGLDFHPWCSAIAHWDLPGNAIDYEQREGRIQRFAGLAVRRGIARSLAGRQEEFFSWDSQSFCSPWTRCMTAVGSLTGASEGLAPWWSFPGAGIERIFPSVEGSESHGVQRRLDRERDLYRLVLGQPNQGRLVRQLLRTGGGEMFELRLRLSPGYREGLLPDQGAGPTDP